MEWPLFSSMQGMATLTPAGVHVFDALEDLFRAWATYSNAQEMRYPSLIRVEDLDSLNYFRNFPQLVMCACTLETAVHQRYSERDRDCVAASIPSADMCDAHYCLPPAACYNVYLSLRDVALSKSHHFTTSAGCFRNEDHFRGLERLRVFTMREIVCVGSAESVKTHLSCYRELLSELMQFIDLPVAFATATDAFFDKQSVGARAERIFPTKEELVFQEKLAIGSLNYHRRFFGKLCNITVNGQVASTGCVAFGIERWMHALSERFGSNAQRICEVLEVARNRTTAVMTTGTPMRAAGG